VIIAFEGIDGTGKSSLAKRISKTWTASLVKFPSEGLITDEKPTDLYLLVSDFTARQPELMGQKIVVDRYLPSLLAYELAARSNRQEQSFLDWIINYCHWIQPDITYYLQVPLEIAQERIKLRGESALAIESLEHQTLVKEAYEELVIPYLKNAGWHIEVIDVDRPLTEIILTDLAQYAGAIAAA
jgi:thymidylate kinase